VRQTAEAERPGVESGLPKEDRGGQGREFVTRVQGSGATPNLPPISVGTGMIGPVTNACWLCGLVISAREDGRSDIYRFSPRDRFSKRDRFSTRTATGPDLRVRPMPSSTEFNCL
jgi:hypothetical protein